MIKFAPKIKEVEDVINKLLSDLEKYADEDCLDYRKYEAHADRAHSLMRQSLHLFRDGKKLMERADKICPSCNHLWSIHDVSAPDYDDYSCNHVGDTGHDCSCCEYEVDDD